MAQSEESLDEISLLIQNSDGAWVNTSRRMMSWHQQIRENLPNGVSLCVRRKGNSWGLACNGIHYLDLVAWWTGETLTAIDISELDLKWTESKRKGIFEITGIITSTFSRGSTITLESRLDKTFIL